MGGRTGGTWGALRGTVEGDEGRGPGVAGNVAERRTDGGVDGNGEWGGGGGRGGREGGGWGGGDVVVGGGGAGETTI